MVKNYLKIAVRNVQKNRLHAFINIAGLTIGMTCVILLFLWAQDELSYDAFHTDIDDIYLVASRIRRGDTENFSAANVPGIGPLLEEKFPEVEQAARFLYGMRTFILSSGDRTFYERRVFPGDPEALRMFTFSLKAGDPETALSDPNSLVLSERTAKKYFGTENPLGKIITVNNEFPMTVAGVMKEIPRNSTFRFDVLMPLEFYAQRTQDDLRSYSNQNYFVFVRLRKDASAVNLNLKIKELAAEMFPDDDFTPELCPFSRFHLYRLGEGGGSIEQIRLVVFIGMFILLIACINFMNLTTARSGKRSKEIGMRKVIGALRTDIVKQFYFETFLLVLISMVSTLFLTRAVLPAFNALFQKALNLNMLQNPLLALFLFGISFIVILLAGSYPALFMSVFPPLRIIKGGAGLSRPKSALRRTLVVFQFALAIGLIVFAAGVYRQLDHLQTMDLGYDMQNILFFSNRGALKDAYPMAKNEFLGIPGVERVTTASTYLTGGRWTSSRWGWEGKDPNYKPTVTMLSVDSDFLETFDISLLAGRSFRREEDLKGNTDQILINKKLAGMLGKDYGIGAGMTYSERRYSIIGIIEDIIPNPRWRMDEPLVIFQRPDRYNYIFLKIRSNDVSGVLGSVKGVFERLNPSIPFGYDFMDEEYANQFSFVRRTRAMIITSALLAVFVSCLGLFGLAAFNTEQRTKEVGIRKALGSSVSRIVLLLSKDLTILVLLANVFAWPAAWWLLDHWLKDFIYRVDINLGIFLAGGASAMLIAIVTVGFQALKAAAADPVESLRYE